jgi:spore coat protein JB
MNMYNGNPNMRRNGGNNNVPCNCANNNLAENQTDVSNRYQNTYSNKNSVIKAVYELGFVMTEVLLYLDTHPNDSEAIEYYAEMRQRYNEAVEAYESMIGPLSFNRTGADNYFDWAATPLPWEKEGC